MGVRLVNLAAGQTLVAIARNAEVGDQDEAGLDEVGMDEVGEDGETEVLPGASTTGSGLDEQSDEGEDATDESS